jgi:hypothetical protein
MHGCLQCAELDVRGGPVFDAVPFRGLQTSQGTVPSLSVTTPLPVS